MKKSVLLLSAVLLGAAVYSQPFANPEYLSSTPFEIGGAALIDLENDGDLDALVCGVGFNAAGIETWKNNNGVFELQTGNIPFGQLGALVFAVGDIDLDGDEDFATVIEGTLVWYANDGSGNFASPTTVQENVGDTRSIALGNLDGDPAPEMVITLLDVEEVLAYPNDGNGNFQSAVTVTTAAVDPIDAMIGDFTGDGLDDIAVACLNSCDVTWYQNLGGLTFGPQNALGGVQIGTYELALADYDGNSHLDIAAVGFGSDDLSIFFNSGGGSFGSQTIVSTNVDGAVDLTVGDFNGDGSPDLCVGGQNFNVPTVFENNGSGGFTEISLLFTNESVFNPEKYLSGDVDNDGKMDLVTASQGDNKLAVYYQKSGAIPSGTNPFMPQQLINKPAAGVNDLVSGDIDGDGLKDLISTERSSGAVAFYRNSASGSLGEREVLLNLPEGLTGLAADDMDGDNDIDLVVANRGDSTVTVFLNQGGGTSFNAVVVDDGFDLPYAPYLSDLDNDGDLDIVQSVGWDAQIYIYPNNGDGTFGGQIILCDYCLFSTGVATADLNGDNLPEIAVYVGQNQEVELYENLGGLIFADSELIIDNVNGTRDIEFFDFDEDGDLDVFASAIFVNRIKYAENLGGLIFAPEEEIPFGAVGPHDLAVLDVDADGDNDLAYTDFFANSIRVIFIEDGVFTERKNVDGVFENPTALLAEDFDGDGNTDLTGCYRNYVAFYSNEAESCASLQPQNLNVDITASTIDFSWDSVPGTVACRLTLQDNSQQTVSQNIVQPEPSSFSAPIGFFQAGSGYNWRVQCACSLNPTEATAPSAVDFFFVPAQLTAFPNPATENLQVKFMSGELPFGKQYQITDLLGRILVKGVYANSISLTGLEPGYYLVKMDGETSRFLKD